MAVLFADEAGGEVVGVLPSLLRLAVLRDVLKGPTLKTYS